MKKLAGIILIVVGSMLLLATVPSLFQGTSKQAVVTNEVAEEIEGVNALLLSSTAVDWEVERYEGSDVIAVLYDSSGKRDLSLKRKGRALDVQVKEQKGFNLFAFTFTSKSSSVKLQIPYHFKGSVELSTVSGDVVFYDDMDADLLYVNTVSGDVAGKNLNVTDLQLNSTSGDLLVEEVQSEKTKFHTVSGDVRITSLLGKLEGKTTSGDVIISYTDENRTANLKTISGYILVSIPNGNANISLKSTSGDLLVNLPLTEQTVQSREIFGKIGEGEFPVNMSTVSGDIILEE
ncbi:DUF4097 family beta strand repeat-containing protein [Bacillus solitudinis]|uniref:DUF4097 family beta strand repeat-containing protein n=1 Tax=Bacillus solitudinis TaxID=2014074 RepID=UPI000C23F7C5|nr:DUF4097 family beta strand repeat-containing protein [Bacillus solitudinis]